MHIFIVSLFVAAALLGLFLLSCIVLKKPIPKPVAMTHGLVAGTGLICLIAYTLNHPTVMTALIVLAGASMGGLYMLVSHRLGKTTPAFIPFVHGSFGLLGLGLLVYYLFG